MSRSMCALVLLVVLTGCGCRGKSAAVTSAPAAAPSPPKGYQARIDALTIDSEENQDEKKEFAADSKNICVLIAPNRIEKKSKIRYVWNFEGQAPSPALMDSTLDLEPGQFAVVKMPAPPWGKWPVGKYRIDLYIDGEIDSAVRFTVK